jgi:hypothetical protein
VIARRTLGLAAALMLGWSLGAIMIGPLHAHAPAAAIAPVAPASLTGPNAVHRQNEPARRHARRRHRG